MQAGLQERLSRETAASCCCRGGERWLALALRACLLPGLLACWGRRQLAVAHEGDGGRAASRQRASASAVAGGRAEGEMSDQLFAQTACPFPRRRREREVVVYV